MARLPQPGSDNGTWGDILNEYLSQALKPDGTIKDNAVTNAAIAPDTITAAEIANGSITEAQLDASVQTKLNASGGSPDWADITNKPAVIAAGVDQSAARAVIGAGTSNLVIGTTSGTAKAGDYVPTKADVGLGNVDNTSDATKNAASVTLTNKTLIQPKIARIDDVNGNAVLTTAAINNAVNYIEITNNGTSYTPRISAMGADSHIGINLLPKGFGRVTIGGYNVPTVSGTDTLTNKTIDGGNNTLQNIPQSAVTNLVTSLAGKAASSHTHTAADVSDSTATGRSVLTAPNQTSARAAIGVDIPTRPLGASYRPLKGVLAGITSSFSTGFDTSGGVTTIDWTARAGKYRFVGMNPLSYPPIPSLAVNDNAGIIAAGDNSIYNSIVVEFWSNATDIRVHYYNITRGDVWAIVDDARIVDGAYQHANLADGNTTWKLTQSTAIWRKWRLCLPTTGLSGIAINSGAGIVETTKGFQMCIIGDSYVHGNISVNNAVAPGTAGIISAGNPVGELEQETGLDIWRCGVSGTGYIADNALGASLGPYGSTARMAGLAALPAMDAIVVWGTANDQAYTTSAIASAASAMWSAIKSARPNTPLIVAGVECAPNYSVVSTTWAPMNTALKAAAESQSGVTAFIDFMGHGWMTGTGNEGGPTGDGNADYFMSSDFIHLTHPGNRYWGQKVARLFSTIPIPTDKTGGSF